MSISTRSRSRFGWLRHPTSTVNLNLGVEEQPIILRASGLTATVAIEQRIEPTQVSAATYTWGPFSLNGTAQVLSSTQNLVMITLPGVYRLAPQVGATGVISFEEDARPIEWKVSDFTAGSGGGGVASTVVVGSSPSASMSGTGAAGSPVTTDVIVSPTAGNALTSTGSGLYVAASAGGGLATVTSADSTSVDFSGLGTAASPLTAVSKVSSTAGNTLVINATGLYVPPSAVVVGGAVEFTLPMNIVSDGAGGHNLIPTTPETLPLANIPSPSRATAIYVNGIRYSAGNYTYLPMVGGVFAGVRWIGAFALDPVNDEAFYDVKRA